MGNNPIAVFENGELRLNVRVDQANDTVWLTQEEMAQLFGVNRQTITKHISNIFRQKELDSTTTSSKMDLLGDPGVTGKRILILYNLDIVLSVGYRVNSKKRHRISSLGLFDSEVLSGSRLRHQRETLKRVGEAGQDLRDCHPARRAVFRRESRFLRFTCWLWKRPHSSR